MSKKYVSKNPHLMSEWYHAQNDGFNPEKITCGSGKKVWWQCKKVPEHIWNASIDSRNRGSGCPYCSGHIACFDNCLQTLNPDLAKQWHSTQNGNLTPNDVTTGSHRKVWWKCDIGHEWQAIIASRAKNGNGCPECGKLIGVAKRRRSILEKKGSLQTLSPNLAKQWHSVKNVDLTPGDVTPGSGRKVWWKCEIGHEWQATINSRSGGRGCPYCNRENQTSFPEQAIYFYVKSIFDDTLNRYKEKYEIDIFVPSLKFGIEYDGVYWHTGEDVSDEEFFNEKGINLLRVKETKGRTTNCYRKDNVIYCGTELSKDQLNRVISECFNYISQLTHEIYEIDINVKRDMADINYLLIEGIKKNSLLVKYPDLSEEWHPDKNLGVKPDMVSSRSGKLVWWQCKKKKHEWQAIVYSRANGRGCPYCAGRLACADNSIQSLFPDIAKQWHPDKNGDLTSDNVTVGSRKTVWWKCDRGHEWEARISHRINGSVCPYCSGRFACIDNCLQILNPEIANQWHPTKNGDLTPYNVTIGSNRKVWWQCEKEHEWQAVIYSRKTINCPYCYKKKGKRALANNCLQILNPKLSEQWHKEKNGGLTPKDVTPGSNKKIWWLCERGHEWQAVIYSRSNGTGCPYCSGRFVCDDNCLLNLNPNLSKQWHPMKNGDLLPKDVMEFSNLKVWWQCEKKHEWQATVNNRSKGNGCPICYKSKM